MSRLYILLFLPFAQHGFSQDDGVLNQSKKHQYDAGKQPDFHRSDRVGYRNLWPTEKSHINIHWSLNWWTQNTRYILTNSINSGLSQKQDRELNWLAERELFTKLWLTDWLTHLLLAILFILVILENPEWVKDICVSRASQKRSF